MSELENHDAAPLVGADVDEEGERWAPLRPPFEGIYEGSTLGRIRRVKLSRGRAYKPGLVMSAQVDKLGYLRHNLTRADGGYRGAATHRLIFAAFNGDIPSGMCINHINGRKDDARLANLELVTYWQNAQHALSTGLSTRGNRHHSSKLTESAVREIRRLAADDSVSMTDLGRRFGVTAVAISAVVRRRTWQHVD